MVRGRKPLAPGKSGVLAVAMKKLWALSLVDLRDALAASGSKPYIEMVLRFVVHLLLRKRPKVHTEEDTRPIALEEEVAKIIAALILRGMDSWVTSSQWAYQAGRSVGEAARLMAMILDEARETTGRAMLYKQEGPMPMARWTYRGWRTSSDAKGCNPRRRGGTKGTGSKCG